MVKHELTIYVVQTEERLLHLIWAQEIEDLNSMGSHSSHLYWYQVQENGGKGQEGHSL